MCEKALVRGIGASFVRATVGHPLPVPLDAERARAQHATYVDAVRSAVEVIALPPDERYPDGCFVEDQAVVYRGRALITRSGAPSRRPEAASVRAVLERDLECVVAAAPATIDGGDVLRVGDTLFVGRSGRTNAAGAEALRACFGPLGARVVPVEVAALHLKCGMSTATPEVVVLADGFADPSLFEGLARVVRVPGEESYAANVLGLPGRVLVAAGYPRTAERLDALGLQVVPVDNSELARADGALTCLSILW